MSFSFSRPHPMCKGVFPPKRQTPLRFDTEVATIFTKFRPRHLSVLASLRGRPADPAAGRGLTPIGFIVMDRELRLDSQALRRARVAAGLTQHQLARLVGVAGGERVSRWELGTSSPRPQLVLHLAGVLGVDLNELYARPREVDLRSLRVAAGMSMDELASRIHASKTTISRWESGDVVRPLSVRVLALLAEALGVSPDVVQQAAERSRSAIRHGPR